MIEIIKNKYTHTRLTCTRMFSKIDNDNYSDSFIICVVQTGVINL